MKPGIDETLVAEQLKLSPDQRLAQLESMYEFARELALAGAEARGEWVAGCPRDLTDIESLEAAREQRERSNG